MRIGTLVGCVLFAGSAWGAAPAEPLRADEKFIPSFAVKYGGSTGWPALEEAARFDVLVMGAGTARAKAHPTIAGNTWQVLKALNPRQTMLLYAMGPGEYNTASWGRLGQGWDWIVAQHGPGSADRWVVVGDKFAQSLQDSAYSHERLMVPGNPAWQQYWLDNVYAQAWGEAGRPTAIADGLFSDNTSFFASFPGSWHREGHPESPEVPSDFCTDGHYDPDAYHRQMKSFVVRAVPWLAGKKLKVGLNFGNMARHPKQWEELDNLTDPPSLAMEEGAFVHPWGGKGSFVFLPENEWLNQVHTMAGLRHVRALMNVHGLVPSEAEGIRRMDAGDASGHRVWDVLWYAMASFLQGLDEHRHNACMNFTVWGYLEFHGFKEFDPRYLHLGNARSASQRVDGRRGHVYVRAFEEGWAVVNPTDQLAEDLAVPEGEARVIDHDVLEQPERRPLVRRFDLPAHRGIVLLKAGRPLGRAGPLGD